MTAVTRKIPSVLGRIVSRESEEALRCGFWGDDYFQDAGYHTQVYTPDHAQSDYSKSIYNAARYPSGKQLPVYALN